MNSSLILQYLSHRVENVIKQLVHTSAVRSSRCEVRGEFNLESKRINQLLIFFHNNEMKNFRFIFENNENDNLRNSSFKKI